VIHEKSFLYFRNMRIFLTISASLIICDRLAAPRATCGVARRSYDGSTGTLLGDHDQWAMLQFYDNAAIRRSTRRRGRLG
jgi:hypothetical protein